MKQKNIWCANLGSWEGEHELPVEIRGDAELLLQAPLMRGACFMIPTFFFTPFLSGVRDWFASLRAGEGELIIENKWSVLLLPPTPTPQPLTTAAAGQWSVDGSGGIKTGSYRATGSNSPQYSKDFQFQLIMTWDAYKSVTFHICHHFRVTNCDKLCNRKQTR